MESIIKIKIGTAPIFFQKIGAVPILIALIIILFCFGAVFAQEQKVNINVGLVLSAGKAGFRSSKPFKIFDSDTHEFIEKTQYSKILLKNGKFIINDNECSANQVTLVPGEKPISIYSEPYYLPYRGNFILRAKSPYNFMVINEIPINEYLVSVLGGELSPDWPPEALKAQAVAARTYALYKKEKNAVNKERDFDVVSTTKDQVYNGIISEKKKCRKAVYETGNLVMRYGGKIIKAYYHSCCGGWTQDGNTVFEEGGKYLRAVECRYCMKSPQNRWQKIISAETIQQALRAMGEDTGRIYMIEPEYYEKSGRLDDIIVFHTWGLSVMTGVDLRVNLGPNYLRSTNFKLGIYKTFDVPYPEAKKKFKNVYKQKEAILQYAPAQQYRGESVPLPIKYNKDKISLIYGDSSLARKDLLSLNILDSQGALKTRDNVYLVSGILTGQDEENAQEFFEEIFNDKNKSLKVPVLYVLYGKGWGHGVGMCQWGALGMADDGYSFREILSHYYAGITIQEY